MTRHVEVPEQRRLLVQEHDGISVAFLGMFYTTHVNTEMILKDEKKWNNCIKNVKKGL